MRYRAALIVALLLTVSTGHARAQAQRDDRSTGWLVTRLETGLAAALGGTVRIGRMDVDWSSLAATIGDVSISIPAEGAPPMTATLTEGRVKLAWSSLGGIAAGDIHITEVVIRGATYSCSREWIDAWRPKSETKHGAVAIQIDRLDVEDANGEYIDGQRSVRVLAQGTDFRGDWSSSRRLLVGEVRTNATVEAPMFDGPWPAAVRGGLRLGAGRLEIFNATGHGPGASAEMSGNVTWGAGTSFTAEGRLDADLGTISPYLAGRPALAGKAVGPVQIVVTGGGVPARVTMQAETTALRIGPITTETARAELTVRPGHLDVDRIEARAYAGTFLGRVGLTFGHPMELTTDLSGKGADLARLIAFSGKKLPIHSAAEVTLAIVGEPARPATWKGAATFDAVPASRAEAGGIPARGRGRVTFDSGRIRVTTETVAMAKATLTLRLELGIGSAPAAVQLALDGLTTDAGATQLAALSFLDALDVPRNRFAVEPLSGLGSFRAAVRSTGRSAEFDLGLDLTGGSYGGEPFVHALLDLGSNDAYVAIRHIDFTRGGASVSGRARFATATGALDSIDLAARGVGVSSVLTRAGLAPWATGNVDLDLRGESEGGTFAALGTLAATNVIVGKEIIDSIEAPVRIENGLVLLDALVARGHGLDVTARVLYDVAKAEANVDVLSASIDLASNRTLAEAGLTSMGTVTTEGSLTIGRDGPSGFLSVAASDFLLDTARSGLREIRLGDVQGSAAISPRGLELAVHSMPDAWTFDAFLGFAKELPLSAVLYFQDLVVGAGGKFGESADLRLKGQVQAEGELTNPRALEINGSFDEVAVRLGARVLKAAEPFPLRLDSGRFLLGPARLQSEAADVALSLSGSLVDGDVAGYVRGSLDLAVVSSLWSEIRGAGPTQVDATLGGTLDRPDLEGRVTVRGGRLRLIGHPQSLESIDAEARLQGPKLTLTSFHAFQGGGEVSCTGEVDFHGFAPASFHATFNGANVSATFPEGFKGIYEGELSLDGTPKRATIAGRIDVVRGLYSKNFDLSLFGGAHREFDATSESALPRNVSLDIDILAPGNVWLRNDIAKVEALGQLHLGGELTRPELTGRFALVPGGTVRYRDVDYRIDSGTLDLTDPKRINPYLDFRGRTRVADYEIGLHIEGTLDKFEYELTSTPPLSSQDIISLLVTGKTLDALSGSAAAAAVPSDMAAYYFAGLLSSTFGRQIQSSLGIDQLEITPLLLKGNADPTARVTVGKRVSDTVKIVFSQDIGTAQKQTYQVSWDTSRRVRLVAESDTESGFGGELQYSRQFGGTPVGLREQAVPGERVDAAGTVASVRVVADGVERADLVKFAKIRVGAPFDRGAMLQAGERIRGALLKKGFIQANVRAEAVADEGPPRSYGIVYNVTPGPPITLEVNMNGARGGRKLRKVLKAFWKETPYTADFWEEATQALSDELQQKGYYAADVRWRATDGPSGRSVEILVDRGKPVRLRAVRFTGVTAISRERIDKQMTSLKSKTLGKRLLRPAVLTEDLASVRALYREEGFTRVRIGAPRISVAATGDAAEVDVEIEEGTRFTVGSLTFPEVAAASEGDLRLWTPLAEGETFSPRRLAAAEQTLRDRLDALGYPDVTVESRIDFSTSTADIAFDVVPGQLKTIDEVVIEGNQVTKNRTVAKALTFGRADLVSKQSFIKSQQQLYRTGLFSSVKLTAAPSGDASTGEQRVTVKVEEAPPLSLGLGAGYDSNDGPRASVLLGYSNLGGRNVAISLLSRISSKLNQEVLTVRRRRVFGNTIDSLGSLLYERTVEDGYTQAREAASIRLEQRPLPRWIRYLRYTLQQVQIYDITDPKAVLEATFKDKLSNVRLADVGLGLVRDTRDDAFLPSRGGYASIEGSLFAKPLGSEVTFGKLFLRGSWTASVKRGSRFASFLRIGAEYPFSGTDVVPLSERFFAGGSNTLRGFATDSVGSLACVPDPIDPLAPLSCFNAGGEALIVLNQEWHVPLWRSLWGELFVDAGNVYPSISEVHLSHLNFRSSAGLGLRLDTPIGPIRAEYGWKLDRREGESVGEFIFAIGAVF